MLDDQEELTLLGVFERHAVPEVLAAFGPLVGFAAALVKLCSDGRAAWPQLQVTPEQFTKFLARHLPPEAASVAGLAELHAPELYLVCACAHGEQAAYAALNAQYLTKVRPALKRLGTPDAMIDDIQQDLRRRLLEMNDPTITRRGYTGRSELANWLCLTAIRDASQNHQRASREPQLEQAAGEILPDHRGDPEMSLLVGQYKDAYQSAFREAVVSLTSREPNLLRYHFLAQLSIEQIGSIYQIHRVTAYRWVTRAEERIAALTRERFLKRVPITASSFPRRLGMLQSMLSVNQGRELKHLEEPEKK